jgi:hypothetical protein
MGVNNMKTFQVPVWFNVNAEDKDTAWEMIIAQMVAMGKYDQLPEWVVEEPVDVTNEEN